MRVSGSGLRCEGFGCASKAAAPRTESSSDSILHVSVWAFQFEFEVLVSWRPSGADLRAVAVIV